MSAFIQIILALLFLVLNLTTFCTKSALKMFLKKKQKITLPCILIDTILTDKKDGFYQNILFFSVNYITNNDESRVDNEIAFVLDSDIIVSEFEFQSYSYVKVWTNTRGERHEPFYTAKLSA